MASNPKTKHMTLAEIEALTRRDKRRMLIMFVAGFLVLGAFLYSRDNAARKYRRDTEERQNQQPSTTSDPRPSSLPPLSAEDLAGLGSIRDDTPEERLLVADPAVSTALSFAAKWTALHYATEGTRDLTPEVQQELASSAPELRLRPFRGRGVLERISERRRAGKSDSEWRGWLALEDGGYVAFIVSDPPPDNQLEEGDFAMLEGLFLQRFRAEGETEWIEAPLLCGRRLLPSVPRITPRAGMLTPALGTVHDDRVGSMHPHPWAAEYELMARALVEEDGIDWDTVPALDTETINGILTDGAAHRGKPFRLRVSVNQGARSLRIDENPLRLERITEAWIGNQTWKSDSPVIRVNLPQDRPELGDRYGEARYLEGELYFLRNFVFETVSGQPGRAPLFVARDLRTFEPEVDPWPQRIMWFMLAGTGLLVLLIWKLLRRDRAESSRLQQELVRRRRARLQRDSERRTAPTPKPDGE